jgi:tetratricopeptide (TPR) repeat protein
MTPRVPKVILVFAGFWIGSVRAEPPETPAQFRELHSAGKTAELVAVFESRADLVSRPLEGWIVGEALLAERRPGDALQLAEALSRNAPASYAGTYLRFREAQNRGDSAEARQIAREVVARPYEPPRLAKAEEQAGLVTRYSGSPARIEFVNSGSQVLRLSWMDSQGKRVLFGTLGRAQSRVQSTYEGHVWDVALASGESVKRVEAVGGMQRVDVGGRPAPGQPVSGGSLGLSPGGGDRGGERVARVSSWYRSPVDLVWLGKLRAAGGSDPKAVMETCFERAIREDPQCEEAFEAVVELALEKSDAQLAGRRVREGLKRFPQNAHLRALLGCALQHTASADAQEAFQAALSLNPRERTALCALAEFAFAREDRQGLGKVLAALPAEDVDGAAFRLADELLGSDGAKAIELQKPHAKTALVLHRAGVLLSSRYRFKEGAELQKAALALDGGFRDARRALAEDLLRLGHAQDAWALVEEVQKEDNYDVTAFNLLELRDRIADFQRIQSPHFEIWMEPAEAAVYGERVQALLERAHAVLTLKYGVKLPRPTTVEIFAQQSDFAVRTFGVPGGDGYLGVCFGPVITAPSPASPRASGHSWEATLWHEFVHTVTLTMTRNRMPRWLSEGISVYEEQQANPGWGQRFRPRHASRVLHGKLTPLEEMAGAFRASSMQEVDFAYFQAGLIVEWLVKKEGMAALRGVLEDLAKGQDLNTVLAKRYGPMAKLNAEFVGYAQNWARALAGTLKWNAELKQPTPAGPDLAAPSKTPVGVQGEEPDLGTFEESMRVASKAIRQKDWEGARKPLERVVQGAPSVRDPDGAYPMLARVYRQLGLEEEETALWEKALSVMADLPESHERLLEIYEARAAWEKVSRVSSLGLGISPMSLRFVEGSIRAAEALGRTQDAISGCRKALLLDPNRAARWHSRLGRHLGVSAPQEARAHLLEALESNPRDRAALAALAALRPPTPVPRPDSTQPSSPAPTPVEKADKP